MRRPLGVRPLSNAERIITQQCHGAPAQVNPLGPVIHGLQYKCAYPAAFEFLSPPPLSYISLSLLYNEYLCLLIENFLDRSPPFQHGSKTRKIGRQECYCYGSSRVSLSLIAFCVERDGVEGVRLCGYPYHQTNPSLDKPISDPDPSSSGIGLETSILFALEGARVIMADISEPALAAALKKAHSIAPHAASLVTSTRVDVSKEASVKAVVDSLDPFGGVDIVFNNAGIMHAQDADALDTPEAVWDLTQNINVKGVWYGCKHAVASMRANKKTRTSIINTASVVALVGSAVPQLAYTASKGAVIAMTRELAIVHAREGFRFNALCPAPLNTPLLQDWLGDDKQKRARREMHLPMGRFGEAIEQAQAVLFLASDESTFVNGADFIVDGGMTKAYVTPEGPPTEAPKNLGRD